MRFRNNYLLGVSVYHVLAGCWRVNDGQEVRVHVADMGSEPNAVHQ